MSLGVLNNISAIYAQNNLNLTQASLQNVLQQLSSGSRISSGADDAAGLAVVDGLKANEAALTQSAQNATNGIGYLQTADGALAQVTNLLNRAVTLATEAANGTLNSSQVGSANQEYSNILSEIGAIGATTNFNGNQLFSNTATNLFVSDGTASGANSYSDQIGILTTSSVGQSLPTGTTTTTALTNATPTASGAAAPSTSTFTVASGETVSGTLTLALGNGAAHSLTVGAGTSQTAFIAAINGDATFASEGITAVQTSATVITISGPASGAGGSLAYGTGVITGSTSGAITPSAPTTAATGGSVAAFTLGAPTNTLQGTLSVQVTGGIAHSITVAAGTTGSSLASKINADLTYGAAGISASYSSSTGILSITGPTGAGKALIVTPTALTQTTVLSPGPGIDFTAPGISALNATTAPAVLINVTNAIADVAFQRGIIGANINQLTAASNVASSETVNLTAASSTIESTNYGTATSNLSKFEVLSQTGISALAQANTVQQEILKLLQ